MRLIATYVTRTCGLFVCVGSNMSSAKAAEPIEMTFGGADLHVGPRNLVLDGVKIPYWKGHY